MSGGSINTDWDGLKRLAKEFFDLAPESTAEQLDNGFKCFGIAWMNCSFEDSFVGRIQKGAEHPALLRIVQAQYNKYRMPLLCLKDGESEPN